MTENERSLPSKEEILEIVEEMIRRFEDLPMHAKEQPMLQYDYQAVLLILAAMLKAV